MADLIDKLEHIVGRKLEFDEVELQDDGSGATIVSWNVDGVTQPTQSEIDAVTDSTAEATVNLRALRKVRNNMLTDTDWWGVSDRTMTQAETDYRQALRDITDTYSSLDTVVWPTKP
jgi:hypothetical protein